MRSRRTEPDTLLHDEVLAVGDQDLRSKCYDRLHRFNADGGTLIRGDARSRSGPPAVSSRRQVDRGRIVRSAPIGDLIDAYESGADGGSVRSCFAPGAA